MAKGSDSSRVRFRLLPTVLLTLAILGLPIAVYAWGRTSSSFVIEKVVVTGAETVPKARLLRLLRHDYSGRNLFTVTSDDVRETLKPVSYIAAVTIDRDFPATLRVRVKEYKPVANVLAAGSWFVVSDQGYVIASVAPEDADNSSASSGSGDQAAGEGPGESEKGQSDAGASTDAGASEGDGDPAEDASAGSGDDPAKAETMAALEAGPSGKHLHLPRLAADEAAEPGRALEDAEARLAVAVVAGLPKSLRQRLATAVTDDGRVTLRFSEGLEAVWGDGDRCLAKTMALRAVLAHYEVKGVKCTFVDVSAPDRVLARPMLQ